MRMVANGRKQKNGDRLELTVGDSDGRPVGSGAMGDSEGFFMGIDVVRISGADGDAEISVGALVVGALVDVLVVGVLVGALVVGNFVGALVGGLVVGLLVGGLVVGVLVGALVVGLWDGAFVVGSFVGALVVGLIVGILVIRLAVGALVVGLLEVAGVIGDSEAGFLVGRAVLGGLPASGGAGGDVLELTVGTSEVAAVVGLLVGVKVGAMVGSSSFPYTTRVHCRSWSVTASLPTPPPQDTSGPSQQQQHPHEQQASSALMPLSSWSKIFFFRGSDNCPKGSISPFLQSPSRSMRLQSTFCESSSIVQAWLAQSPASPAFKSTMVNVQFPIGLSPQFRTV